jgi:DNA mismatch endonuclease Vsr
MTDIVDPTTRSRMMSGIGTANTKPELVVRKLLFAQGFRYRLHRKDLPGKRDLVLPKYEVAIFVHGCFWHCHECHLFNRNYSRRQASGFSIEAIFRTRRQVLQIRQFHVVGDLSKPHTRSNTPTKQAFL